jgi:hypothetical protein
LLKWYIELSEGEKLTNYQLLDAISRLKEGQVNLRTTVKNNGLL